MTQESIAIFTDVLVEPNAVISPSTLSMARWYFILRSSLARMRASSSGAIYRDSSSSLWLERSLNLASSSPMYPFFIESDLGMNCYCWKWWVSDWKFKEPFKQTDLHMQPINNGEFSTLFLSTFKSVSLPERAAIFCWVCFLNPATFFSFGAFGGGF